MNPTLKKVATILILIGLITGVTYLGIKIFTFSQLPNTTSGLGGNTVPQSGTPTPESTIPSEKFAVSKDQLEKLSEYQSCKSSIECTVISEPVGTTDDGQEITQNHCINAQYLKTCSNCREDKGFQAELAKEKICSCVNSICDLSARDGSDTVPYTQSN